MKDFPGVSVILPVFFKHISAENIFLLRDALNSVQHQNYHGPIEIILVDDGSPNPVQDLASELGQAATRNLKWLRLSRNQGIVGALNAGIAASTYPLIARMDADDLWLDGKLEKQISQFQSDPDLTISATGMVCVDTSRNEISRHIRPGDWAGILRFFKEVGCPFPHGSVVADKRVYQLLGGYPHDASLRHCEDFALWGIWLRFFKPAMIEEALYSYRVSNNSTSGIHGSQQREASRKVQKRFIESQAADTVPQALPMLARELGINLFEAGKLAYQLWHMRGAVTIPTGAVKPLSDMLSDCLIVRETHHAPSWMKVLGMTEAEVHYPTAIRVMRL